MPWRIAFVGQENQIEDVHLLFSPFLPRPPSWPLKREYNSVSAIADETWQYRTGGNLTIFDKDHDAADMAKVLATKHTASLQLLCTVGSSQATVDACAEFKISERLPKGGVKLVVQQAVAPIKSILDLLKLLKPKETFNYTKIIKKVEI